MPHIVPIRIVVYLTLAALVVGLTLFFFFGPEPVPSLAKPTPERGIDRRGDDPTYAEELKKMSALVQDIRYRFKDSETRRAIEQEQTANLVQRETQRAMQQSRQNVDELNRALQEARKALDEKIQAADPTPVTQQLRAQIERLTQEQEALRTQWATRPPATPAQAETRPEANRILTPDPEDRLPAAAAPRAPGDPPLARPHDLAPGAPQVDQGMLDPLRNLPGMGEVVERLTGSALNNPRHPGAALTAPWRGLPGDYITLTPYGTERRSARGPVRASATQTTPLQPKRYPFTVRTGQDGATAVIPVYTLPDAATLVENSTMTPLIGRVPFRGTLTDPFRFKLITGATNLATNGHRIPGVAHAVWTGYAVGVREQSCVRAYLDTVTFTFEDGRIHTVRRGKGNTQAVGSVNETLGYLTDPWGKPCIRGRFFNNAGEYLKDRSMAAFLDGLANAYAQSKVTVDRDASGVSHYVSGNTYEYALGKGLGGASSEIADYVRERADGAFDVVYVPPGRPVQIFVEHQIPIDYDTNGRKLSYRYGSGAAHDLLD